MSKYLPLTDHLKRVSGDRYPLTFAEIERIVGDQLPASARKHRAWWSNNPDNSVMTKAWLAAGWYSSDVDMEGQKLIFRRRNAAASGFEEQHPTGLQGHTLAVAITPAAVANLRIRAAISGQTVEQLASEILTGGARLTMKERLVIADRIRASGPALRDVDVPAMIREDRDSR